MSIRGKKVHQWEEHTGIAEQHFKSLEEIGIATPAKGGEVTALGTS